MVSNSTHWENALFGIFTTDLTIDNYFDDFYFESTVNKSCGCIVPGERVNDLIEAAAHGFSYEWPSQVLTAEFEKEVSSNINNLRDFDQRKAYLIRMQIRFQKMFDLLPIYNQVLPKLFENILENEVSFGLDYYNRLYFFTYLISEVKRTIQEKLTLEISVQAQIDNFNHIEKSSKFSFVQFKHDLKELGFFQLEKVSLLNGENSEKLISLLMSNEAPYQIAMFDHLGLIKYLDERMSNNKRDKKLGAILKINERGVKGNISVLCEKSGDDRSRYTAHKCKGTVKDDYEKL